MNRRALLPRLAAPRPAAAVASLLAPALPAPAAPHYARPAGPAGTTGTLAPYAGPWGATQAAHLLRRTTFGPTRAEIGAAAAASLSAVIGNLFSAAPVPTLPLNVSVSDTSVPIGQTWVGQPYDANFEGVRRGNLRSWWLGQLLDAHPGAGGGALREKMTLFWHNHFVVEFLDINDARYGYEYVRLLREHALGNCRQLTKDVTITPAMLRYLNGNQSTAAAPNENYGRELLELFTVGKGPLIGPGNYTHYTEADVQAAARALTGWRDNATTVSGYYTAARHDNTARQFSAALGGGILAPTGATQYQGLIDLIFGRPETANFLARKLYRWFVYYDIDAQVEADIIQPLAALLRQNNFDVAPALRALLSSQHFFDPLNIGCLIKSPLDLTVGLIRQPATPMPPATAAATVPYSVYSYLLSAATTQQQTLGDPPNVAGWSAYYQTPQYNRQWLNAVTLPRRQQLADVLTGAGVTRAGFLLRLDPIGFVLSLPAANALNPNLVVAAFTELLLPLALTATQLAYLKNALIPGLPDFEWTIEWNDFLTAPTNAAKRQAVLTKLQGLLRALLGLAEFQLS